MVDCKKILPTPLRVLAKKVSTAPAAGLLGLDMAFAEFGRDAFLAA